MLHVSSSRRKRCETAPRCAHPEGGTHVASRLPVVGRIVAIDVLPRMALIDGAVKKAKADPKPQAADLLSDVYVSYP